MSVAAEVVEAAVLMDAVEAVTDIGAAMEFALGDTQVLPVGYSGLEGMLSRTACGRVGAKPHIHWRRKEESR